MNDSIDRQTVIDMVKGWNLNQHIMNEEDALDDVNVLPSAQPERKKGKWIVHKASDEQHCGLVDCPFCGEEMIAEADEYSFCPSCGADMRQREDTDE